MRVNVRRIGVPLGNRCFNNLETPPGLASRTDYSADNHLSPVLYFMSRDHDDVSYSLLTAPLLILESASGCSTAGLDEGYFNTWSTIVLETSKTRSAVAKVLLLLGQKSLQSVLTKNVRT